MASLVPNYEESDSESEEEATTATKEQASAYKGTNTNSNASSIKLPAPNVQLQESTSQQKFLRKPAQIWKSGRRKDDSSDDSDSESYRVIPRQKPKASFETYSLRNEGNNPNANNSAPPTNRPKQPPPSAAVLASAPVVYDPSSEHKKPERRHLSDSDDDQPLNKRLAQQMPPTRKPTPFKRRIIGDGISQLEHFMDVSQLGLASDKQYFYKGPSH